MLARSKHKVPSKMPRMVQTDAQRTLGLINKKLVKTIHEIINMKKKLVNRGKVDRTAP